MILKATKVSNIDSCFLYRDVDDDYWAIDAATKTIQKLLEIENKGSGVVYAWGRY